MHFGPPAHVGQRLFLSPLEKVALLTERIRQLEAGSPSGLVPLPTDLDSAEAIARAELVAGVPHAPGEQQKLKRAPLPGTDWHDEVVLRNGCCTVTRFCAGAPQLPAAKFWGDMTLRVDFDPQLRCGWEAEPANQTSP